MPRSAVLVATFALLSTSAAHAASLQQVSNWGANGVPSDVSMYVYVPDKVVKNPPVLTLVHYCGGTAPAVFGQAQGGGIVKAADQYGFIMVVPSSGRCWDIVSNKTRTRDGGGDSHAIKQMVTYALATYQANPDRVYSTGDSSGGMMTELLLAVYPDLFKAGAAFAGMPAGCRGANESGSGGGYSGACAAGTVSHTAQDWGDIARMLYPGYTGHRPRVQLFHGDADTTIKYPNHTEAIKEWSNVLGLKTDPDMTDTNVALGTHQATRKRWKNECGYVTLDTFTSLGGDHGPSDALFKAEYVIPFLGLDKTGAVDPELDQCKPGAGGSGGTAGVGGGTGAAGAIATGGIGGSGEGSGAGGTSSGAGGVLGTAGGGQSGSANAGAGTPSGAAGGAGTIPSATAGSAASAAGAGGVGDQDSIGCACSAAQTQRVPPNKALLTIGVAIFALAARRRRSTLRAAVLGMGLSGLLLGCSDAGDIGTPPDGVSGSAASAGAAATGVAGATGGTSQSGNSSGGASAGPGGAANPVGGAATAGTSAGAASLGGVASGGGAGGSQDQGGGSAGPSGGGGGPGGSGGASGYAPCPTDGNPCLILPFGDSITNGVGSTDKGGYRAQLFKLVVQANQKAKLIGSLSDGPDQVAGVAFPKAHEGHSGWTIDSGYVSFGDGISTLVPTPAFKTIPHIVLLMIGTNDVSASKGTDMIAIRLDALLDKIVQAAPKALVVVSQLTPIGWNPPVAASYNAKIPDIVRARVGKGQHFAVVDMSKMPTSALGSDSLHPNDTGYAFMAGVWYAAIKDYLRE